MDTQIKCIAPEQVNETDYLAYINQDGRLEFSAHLAACPFCRQEVATLGQLDKIFTRQLHHTKPQNRAACYDTQKLGEYALGMLNAKERGEIERHLKDCAYCPEEVAELKSFLKQPDATLERIAANSTPLAGLRRVVAALMQAGPGPSLGVPMGVRGSAAKTPQVYRAEDVQVTLIVQPTVSRPPTLAIEGLIYSDSLETEDLEGAEVKLLQDSAQVKAARVDDTGNFAFSNLSLDSTFEIEITLPDKVVLIPNIGIS
ncbi:MAG TPA: zf-HC2 domain-containing protein [Chloroflexia bacterium]|nr:zf-HC2 domain-containing protein [Chloroflexia bacterium]